MCVGAPDVAYVCGVSMAQFPSKCNIKILLNMSQKMLNQGVGHPAYAARWALLRMRTATARAAINSSSWWRQQLLYICLYVVVVVKPGGWRERALPAAGLVVSEQVHAVGIV